MLTIRLPADLEERLNDLAKQTGRSKTALAREAIMEYLVDPEDFHLGESRARLGRKAFLLPRWSVSLA